MKHSKIHLFVLVIFFSIILEENVYACHTYNSPCPPEGGGGGGENDGGGGGNDGDNGGGGGPPPNKSPTANFDWTPQNPEAGITVSFQDLSTDSDGTVSSWVWYIKDKATGSNVATYSEQNPTHNFSIPGVFEVTLTVSDNKNASKSLTKELAVFPQGSGGDISIQSIVAKNGSQSEVTNFEIGESITFEAFVNGFSGFGKKTYSWRFENATPTTSSQEIPTVQFNSSGQKQVTLRVTEEFIITKSDNISKTYTVIEPVQNATSVTINASPLSGNIPLTVFFNADARGFSTSNLNYSWNFGDNSFGTGQSVEHVYTNSGSFFVQVTVSVISGPPALDASTRITINAISDEEVPVDTIDGFVSILYPSDEQTVFGNVGVVVNSNGVTNVAMYINGEKYDEISSFPFTFEWNTREEAEEKFDAIIKVVAINNSGIILINSAGREIKDEIDVKVDNSNIPDEIQELYLIGKPTITVSSNTVYSIWQTSKNSDSKFIYWSAEKSEDEAIIIEDKSFTTIHRLTAFNVKKGSYFYKVESSDGKETVVSQTGFFEIKTEDEDYPPGFQLSYCNLYCGSNSSGFVSTNKPPVINRINVLGENTDSEGRPFTFVAESFDPDLDKLNYLWDYGDGTTDFGENLQRVTHTFYLTDGVQKKNFTVKLFVDDSISGRTKKSTSVEVSKSKFIIKLLEPISAPQKRLEKGKTYNVKVQLLDSKDNPIESNEVIDIVGKIAGKEISFTTTEQKGIYSGTIQSNLAFSSPITYISIDATLKDNQASTTIRSEFPLYFSPASFSLSTNPFKSQESLFIGKKVGTVKFKIKSESGLEPEKANLKAVVVSGNTKREFPAEKLGEDFAVDVPVQINEDDIDGGMIFRIEGEDSFGNKVKENTFVNIPILKENPFFNVELINPKRDSDKVAFGQDLELRANIIANDDLSLSNIIVTATNTITGKTNELLFDLGQAAYVGKMKAPDEESGKENFSFRVNAWLLSGKQNFRDFEDFTFNLTNKLNVEFVRPTENISIVSPQDSSKIAISVTYPDNSFYEKETINANLVIDGKEYLVDFVKNESGIFEAEVDSLNSGVHTLSVKLNTKLVGFDEIESTVIFVDFGLMFISLGVIIALWFSRSVIKDMLTTKTQKKAIEEARIKKLNDRREALKIMLSTLKQGYYKRQVSEKEYKENVLKAQQELSTIEKKIGINSKRRLVKENEHIQEV